MADPDKPLADLANSEKKIVPPAVSPIAPDDKKTDPVLSDAERRERERDRQAQIDLDQRNKTQSAADTAGFAQADTKRVVPVDNVDPKSNPEPMRQVDTSIPTGVPLAGADPKHPPKPQFVAAEPDPESDVAGRRRAFEDNYLGKDAVRINGQVERGVGSPYSRLSEHRKREYDALERAEMAELRLAEVRASAMAIEAEYNDAIAAVDAAEAAEDPADPNAPAVQ
jgi:hypothetical protein